MSSEDSELEEGIIAICEKDFQQTPSSIVRMKVGICSEVYSVALEEQEVVVRLNSTDRWFLGSDKYIPLFKELTISVPEILARDYSKTLIPWCYQIQSKLAGQDIGCIISELGRTQLETIAEEIAAIIRKLAELTTNGEFGYLNSEAVDLKENWFVCMDEMRSTMFSRGRDSRVLDSELESRVDSALEHYRPYFESVPSTFYYDDLCSKNVMIADGVFQGLVDLDGVMYGDPLEAVGRIKACWPGTRYGDTYTEAVCNALSLNSTQKEAVAVYAFLNRVYWLCEAGVQFNQNSSTTIDWVTVNENKEIVKRLWEDVERSL